MPWQLICMSGPDSQPGLPAGGAPLLWCAPPSSPHRACPHLYPLVSVVCPLQMEVLLPMTVRFANPIQCGGSWGFVRYHGFFT